MANPLDLTPAEEAWLDRMKETMSLELARCMRSQMPPRALVERLMGIPEVDEAMRMRAKGRTTS
jgi:hypothetical protein